MHVHSQWNQKKLKIPRLGTARKKKKIKWREGYFSYARTKTKYLFKCVCVGGELCFENPQE